MPSPRPACLLLATTASRASHRRLAHATTSQSSAALPLFVSLSCRVHVLGLHRDFAHTVDKFYGELPEDANDFGAELNNVFPLIFDTKHVLSRYFVIASIYRTVENNLRLTYWERAFTLCAHSSDLLRAKIRDNSLV